MGAVQGIVPSLGFGVLVVLALLGLFLGTAWITGMSPPRRQLDATAGLVRPSAQTQPGSDWRAIRARFAQLRSEYGQFECDPLAVLRLPALIDVTVASTGRFVEAFAEAQALDTDTEPPKAHRVRFATAVNQAWCAWRAARDAAERIRFAGIPAQELAIVQRVIKLLSVARHFDHDAERIAAYAKARSELAKLERSGTLRLPPAAAALDAAARGQLRAVNSVNSVGLLRGNGLRAAVATDDAGGQEPHLPLRGVRVLVAPYDEASACRLLAATDDAAGPVGGG